MRSDTEIFDLPDPIIREQRARLLRSLGRAARTHDADFHELQGAVCEIVDRARADGRTPESLIIFFKRELEQTVKQDIDRVEYAALTDRIVRWCIERYYGDD